MRRLDRNDPAGAEEAFRRALAEAELRDDLRGQAEAWNNLGTLARGRGAAAEAAAFHRKALALHARVGAGAGVGAGATAVAAGEARTRMNLGAALLDLGGTAAARDEVAAAERIYAAMERPVGVARAKLGLAAVTLQGSTEARSGGAGSGTKGTGTDQGEGAGSGAKETGTGDGSGKGAGSEAKGTGASAALSLAGEALLLAEEAGDEATRAASFSVKGSALEALGDFAGALSAHDEALRIDRFREAPAAIADDLRALARVHERLRGHGAASAYLARASRVARRLGRLDDCERDLVKAVVLAKKAGLAAESAECQAELDALRGARAAPGAPAAPGAATTPSAAAPRSP